MSTKKTRANRVQTSANATETAGEDLIVSKFAVLYKGVGGAQDVTGLTNELVAAQTLAHVLQGKVVVLQLNITELANSLTRPEAKTEVTT